MSTNDTGSSGVTNPPPIMQAETPFDDLTADVILRTSDRVDFCVHRTVLSLASPVFRDMFSLPVNISEDMKSSGAPSLPVIEVTEDKNTMRRLLMLCYPFRKPPLELLENIEPFLRAAIKYEMECPIELLSQDLLAAVPRSPLCVWAVGCRSELDEVVQRAAAEIRGRAVAPESALSVMEDMLKQEGNSVLEGTTAAQYFRLRKFLRANISDQQVTMDLRPPSSAFSQPPRILRLPPAPAPPPDIILQGTD